MLRHCTSTSTWLAVISSKAILSSELNCYLIVKTSERGVVRQNCLANLFFWPLPACKGRKRSCPRVAWWSWIPLFEFVPHSLCGWCVKKCFISGVSPSSSLSVLTLLCCTLTLGDSFQMWVFTRIIASLWGCNQKTKHIPSITLGAISIEPFVSDCPRVCPSFRSSSPTSKFKKAECISLCI